VLFDVSLSLPAGSITVLLGRNGVGKSTLVRCLAGLLPIRGGRIRMADIDVTGRAAHEMAAMGLGVLLQGKRMFPSLTVAENLDLGSMTHRRRIRRRRDTGTVWTRERILELFPVFADRLRTSAGSLSGGEQQMLALARTMAGGPSVLVLDEPSEALSPARVAELGALLATLRTEGMPVLLVEQNLEFACALADSVHVMDKGEIAFSRGGDSIAAERARIESLLTV
jgi:ABC-type branched-subunit amino acid transport system ATPase component